MTDKYNAFLKIFDTPIQAKKDGKLAGMKLAIKDNILIEGQQATASSKILEGFVAPYDATVIRKLKEAGAVFVGKTNLDEFAMGSSTETSAYGTTINPWGENLVPGGSSGGSAAAVAADLCEASLGSDTGGSIRQPAAFCGITGLKPTYGTVSRYGLIALASSLDQIGPFARSAEDVEKVFSVISGKDEHDQTTVDYKYQPQEIDFKKLRVGLPKELWQLSMDPEITEATKKFVDYLEKKGATVKGISLPSIKYGLSAYYIIMPAEAMANLERFDGIRFQSSAEAKNLLDKYVNTRSNGFGTETKRRILLGTFVLSVGHFDDYYQAAVKVRQLIKREYEKAFEEVDVIVSATTPTLPFKIGEKVKDPIAMYQSDLLTVSVNLADLPGLSLPCGFSKSNLPIGAQIVGPAYHENVLLGIAKEYQKETDYHLRKPNE